MDARERERESGASSHARRVFCSRRHARALSVARTLTPATLPRADRNSMRNHIAHHLASPLTSEPRSKHTQTISTRSAPSTRPRPASPAWQSPMHRSPPRAGPPLRRTSPKRRSHLRRTSRPRGKVRVWRGGVSGRRAEASPSRSIAPPRRHAARLPQTNPPPFSLSPLHTSLVRQKGDQAGHVRQKGGGLRGLVPGTGEWRVGECRRTRAGERASHHPSPSFPIIIISSLLLSSLHAPHDRRSSWSRR